MLDAAGWAAAELLVVSLDECVASVELPPVPSLEAVYDVLEWAPVPAE